VKDSAKYFQLYQSNQWVTLQMHGSLHIQGLQHYVGMDSRKLACNHMLKPSEKCRNLDAIFSCH